MQSNNTQYSNWFMVLEFFLCTIIVFFNLTSRAAIVSKAFTFSFFVLLAFFLYVLNSKGKKLLLFGNVLSILFVSFFCILLNTLSSTVTLNFKILNNYFLFASTIIFMFIMLNIDVDMKTAKRILYINIFIAVLYPIAYRYFPQQIVSNVGIHLNFSNPNLTAMWILQSLLYLSLAFFCLKSKILKVLCVLIFIENLRLLSLTNARNSMIALFLYGVCCLWIFIKQTPRFSKILIGAINILPITFLFVYLQFIDIISKSERLQFLVSEGKNLTSRVEIWQRNLNKIKDCWLIGSYYTAPGNTHNAHLVVLGSFGAITLVLTIYFMYKLCCIVDKGCTTKKSLYCLTAFFAVIFMGIGEGAFFSGAMGIYIMACGYIYLARCDFNSQTKNLIEDRHGGHI